MSRGPFEVSENPLNFFRALLFDRAISSADSTMAIDWDIV